MTFPSISKKLTIILCISLVLIAAVFSYFIQLSYSKKFRTFGVSLAIVTNINESKGGVSGYTYNIGGVKYYGTSGYSNRFKVEKRYHLLYSLNSPKYNIILWSVPVDEKLLKGDIDINDYIGFGKQRIDKATIIEN